MSSAKLDLHNWSKIMANLNKEKAQALFDEGIKGIHDWGNHTTNIKRIMYLLLKGNAYIALKYKSHAALFKDLFKDSGLHRSTLYDYLNAIKMEIELGLEHGYFATETLLALKQNIGTTEERKRVMEIADESCKEGEYPTKKMILQAIEKYEEECNEAEEQEMASLRAASKKDGVVADDDTESEEDDVEEKEAPPIRKPAIKQTDEEYQAEIDKHLKSKSNTKLKPKVDSDDIAEIDDDNWISPKKYGRDSVLKLGAENAEILANMLIGVSKKSLRIEYKKIRKLYPDGNSKRVAQGIFAAIE